MIHYRTIRRRGTVFVGEEGDIKHRRVAENQLINERHDMRFLIASIFLAGIFFAGSVPVFGQQDGQRQMQQMQQMNQMQDNINRMMERTRTMTRDMAHQVEQSQNEQMRNQFQMMHRFGEQLEITLGNMKNTAERCELMLQNRDMMRNQDMERDMQRMQRHLSEMNEAMDETIQTMERMTRRLREHQPD